MQGPLLACHRGFVGLGDAWDFGGALGFCCTDNGLFLGVALLNVVAWVWLVQAVVCFGYVVGCTFMSQTAVAFRVVCRS